MSSWQDAGVEKYERHPSTWKTPLPKKLVIMMKNQAT